MITLEINWHDTGKIWRHNGVIHRDNGPAIVIPNTIYQFWFKHSKPHRLDGPAVVRLNGTTEFWINGNRVTEYELMFYLTLTPN